MKTIDITIDFETCALCPTAAVMSVGAVAWDRNATDSPFYIENVQNDCASFSKHIDLRSAFLDGFTFDQDTANWWSKQSEKAKNALLSSDDTPLQPLKEVVESLFSWIGVIKEMCEADDVYLWSQGSDFDIAILRNICDRYKLSIPVKYTHFRDHRTYFLEAARNMCEVSGKEYNEKEAYTLVENYEGKGEAHDPVFDCKRSIYSAWQMMKNLKLLPNRN